MLWKTYRNIDINEEKYSAGKGWEQEQWVEDVLQFMLGPRMHQEPLMGLEPCPWGVRARSERRRGKLDCHCASGQRKYSIHSQSRTHVKAVHGDTEKHNHNLLWLYHLCVGADGRVGDLFVLDQRFKFTGVGQTGKLAHISSVIMSVRLRTWFSSATYLHTC